MKAKKWTNLQGNVPEVLEELTEREAAIRTVCDELRIKPMRELAVEYGNLEEENEFADLASKARSIQFEALERVLVAELKRVKEISGDEQWRGEGYLFSGKLMIIPVVKDPARLAEYIQTAGLDALRSVPYPRLKSLVIDMLESFQAMTPAERAACPHTPQEPLPGVALFLKSGVHRTKS